jgi:urea transport system ATP-binding protein
MLSIQNISVNYGESRILNDIHMKIPMGQVVCLLGRNGVGKTTLMKSIMGLLKPRQGEMMLEGKAITRWSASQRARAGLGYVPQGRGIFPRLTVYDNLLLGFEAVDSQRVDKASLEESFELFPVLKEMRRRLAGTLSGGQQQQLAFARILVRRPKILLLDEPTEGIQPSIMLEIENVILRLQAQGDMSILLVEQYLDFALSVGSYFYIMETGSIVMEGPAAEFNDEKARSYLAV